MWQLHFGSRPPGLLSQGDCSNCLPAACFASGSRMLHRCCWDYNTHSIVAAAAHGGTACARGHVKIHTASVHKPTNSSTHACPDCPAHRSMPVVRPDRLLLFCSRRSQWQFLCFSSQQNQVAVQKDASCRDPTIHSEHQELPPAPYASRNTCQTQAASSAHGSSSLQLSKRPGAALLQPPAATHQHPSQLYCVRMTIKHTATHVHTTTRHA
jgi:hypothetical protein